MTQRKNSYILVIGDYFTRWMEAIPLPSQKAEEIAKVLVHEFIAKFGAPLQLHTDQGKNFESVLFKEVCRLLEIKKTRTTPYHPSSNGLVERFNRTLAKMMKSFINENKSNWDEHLPLLTAAYRSTPHSATGFTPNKLMLGREVYLPCDVVYTRPSTSNDNIPDFVQNLKTSMEECYTIVRKNLQKAAQTQKQSHDRKLVVHSYAHGDLCSKEIQLPKNLKPRG